MKMKTSVKSVIAGALALAGMAAATAPALAQVYGSPYYGEPYYGGYYDYGPGVVVAPGPYFAPFSSGPGFYQHRHCDNWSIRGC